MELSATVFARAHPQKWKATALQPAEKETAWMAAIVSCGRLQGSIEVSWEREISSKGTYTYVGLKVIDRASILKL